MSAANVLATAIRMFGIRSPLRSSRWGNISRANISSGKADLSIRQEQRKTKVCFPVHWLLWANWLTNSKIVLRNKEESTLITRIKLAICKHKRVTKIMLNSYTYVIHLNHHGQTCILTNYSLITSYYIIIIKNSKNKLVNKKKIFRKKFNFKY